MTSLWHLGGGGFCSTVLVGLPAYLMHAQNSLASECNGTPDFPLQTISLMLLDRQPSLASATSANKKTTSSRGSEVAIYGR